MKDNKNFKVIQIHGFSGLLLLSFMVMCLFCGFVIFPVWLLKSAWNSMIAGMFDIPTINKIQAGMLWAFIVLLMYTIFKNKLSLKVIKSEDFDDIEVTNFIENSAENETPEEVKK